MSHSLPELEDYVRLFSAYGKELDAIYKGPDDQHYALLFEQMIRLLIKPSSFNLFLPEPFRTTAHRYHAGDPVTVNHFSDPAIRHFMLSEVHDFVCLLYTSPSPRD